MKRNRKLRTTWNCSCIVLGIFVAISVAQVHAQALPQPLGPRRAALQYQPPTVQSRPNTLQPIQQGLPATPSVDTPVVEAAESTIPPRLPDSDVLHGNQVGLLPVNDRHLLVSPGHLNDIAFADLKNGVAIGNQGLIWRTSDGGRQWNAVRTDWSGDLHSVVFADAKNGWIVGGRALPIRGLHEGVVLRTQDGGVTWRQLSSTLLTRLTRIGYDHQHKKLWAVGEPDGQFPAGLFESFDLGQNWNDVTLQMDVDNSANTTSTHLATAKTASSDHRHSIANVALCLGDEWILSNRQGIFRCVGDRATRVAIPSSTLSGAVPQELRFREIRNLGNRLAALGTDGKLYFSHNRGQKWEICSSVPGADENMEFRLLTTKGESLWLAPRVGKNVYHFNNQLQQWTCQTLPSAAQLNTIVFADERYGWIGGTNGQVWITHDGGTNWHLQHRTHAGLAVLLLAATAEDIPQELVAHLAVNQGLQVGVLCGGTEIATVVCEQAFWQNEVASVLIDPVPFDPYQPSDRLRTCIQAYLNSLQPRVILVCPPSRSGSHLVGTDSHAPQQVQAASWLDAAQEQHRTGNLGVAVIATLSQGDGETSISNHALATNVGQLLNDVAWPSTTLIDAWRQDVAPTAINPRGQQTWGIRRLAMLEPVDMSWFQPQTAKNDSFGRTLSSRPVRTRTSATNLESINQMARKSSWMHQLNQVPTSTAAEREQWLRGLRSQLSIPESLQSIWMADLAQYCSTRGDLRKATLVRWEILQSALDKPDGLAVLIPTLNWLISDEAQWEGRAEARAARLKRFAELQELFAQEEAEGELSEEERRKRALHRFGVEPGMEDQVPAEAVQWILLLDKAQREATRTGRINPDPEIAKLAAVPETKMVTNVQSKQFQNKMGQLQHQTTEVSWDTPLKPESAPSAVSPANPASSLVDLSTEQRLQMAANLVRRAESLWPSLNGLPEWWQLKARVRQELRDVAQTEVAWNKLVDMNKNPWLSGSNYCPTSSLQELEQLRLVSVAMAEYGERFRLESVGVLPAVATVSQMDSTSAALTSARARSLAVHWTLERPYLDGQLHEWLWQNTPSLGPLTLAQDEQYFFIGIRVPGAPSPIGGSSAVTTSNQEASPARDQASLENGLALYVDTDADDLASFEIVFDAEGRIRDRQNGFDHWNPAIFVARQQGDSEVMLEIAIDLEDLAPPQAGKPWRIRLESRAPGHVEELEKAWIQMTDIFGE